MERIVLAYSGGFDTSLAIPWLASGTARPKSSPSRWISGRGWRSRRLRDRRARRGCGAGARARSPRDVRHRLRAAVAQGRRNRRGRRRWPRRLARPLIAEKLVDVARIEQAAAVAHGASATGEDRVDARSGDLCALAPDVRIMPRRACRACATTSRVRRSVEPLGAPSVGSARRKPRRLPESVVQARRGRSAHARPNLRLSRSASSGACRSASTASPCRWSSSSPA